MNTIIKLSEYSNWLRDLKQQIKTGQNNPLGLHLSVEKNVPNQPCIPLGMQPNNKHLLTNMGTHSYGMRMVYSAFPTERGIPNGMQRKHNAVKNGECKDKKKYKKMNTIIKISEYSNWLRDLKQKIKTGRNNPLGLHLSVEKNATNQPSIPLGMQPDNNHLLTNRGMHSYGMRMVYSAFSTERDIPNRMQRKHNAVKNK